MKKIAFLFLLLPLFTTAQLKWKNVDSAYQPLPKGFHVYYTNDLLDGKPNIAYYVEADLKNKQIEFTTDTTQARRITPTEFYNRDRKPLLVTNCSFFEYANNSNINVIMKDGKMLAYNLSTIAARGKDTMTYYHVTGSAIGISKKRKADVAWLYTDSSGKLPVAFEVNPVLVKDSTPIATRKTYARLPIYKKSIGIMGEWKMKTAVGGGPVLIHDGEIRITNNEERKFTGNAIKDKHPRTAMGYTKDGKLIILVVQGRYTGVAEGATLEQEAAIFKSLNCWEALNLDGGGSSCMLVNGKETIKPSEKGEQRPVPAVFIINTKHKQM